MKNKTKTLHDRMKEYESITKTNLMKRTPVIVRVDGRAFHTFTKGFVKPFDTLFLEAMRETALDLFKNIPYVKFAYTESDEISLILLENDFVNDTPFFDNDLQKIVSLTSSMATLYFNNNFVKVIERYAKSGVDVSIYRNKYNKATFDSRAFNIPFFEVDNYILDRQLDSKRNSLNAYAQSLYSAKALFGKKHDDLINLLHDKGVHYHDIDVALRHGVAVYKVDDRPTFDYALPSLTVDKTFVSRIVLPDFSKDDDKEEDAPLMTDETKVD